MDHRRTYPGLVEHVPPPDGTRRAAVLVALFPDGDDVRVVLTKRPLTMPTHAGHLAFPGGRADPEDTDEVATALREAHEEMGIEPSSVEVIGFLPSIHTVQFALWVVPGCWFDRTRSGSGPVRSRSRQGPPAHPGRTFAT